MSNTNPLVGQRTIVVGASSGIGRALASELVNRGARVVAVARRAERIAELQGVVPIVCDVSIPGAIEAMVERAVRELGGLDAIAYAAGLTALRSVAETDYSDWLRVYSVNVFGPALVTRAALGHLLSEESQGRAVYLSSVSAESPYPGLVAYGSSKAALGAFAQGLANEVGQLRVTEIMVGPTAGTGIADAFEPDAYARWWQRWIDEGFMPYATLQVDEVVPTIIATLSADDPPALVGAMGERAGR